ncbi:MAG: amidophosphoribosyltransferase, partial [Candidatus Omnitrophota bacterium]
MSGIFGVISSKGSCTQDLFYGTDYHSHMGTEYGGMVVLGKSFTRQIHNISQSQFKSKFYEDSTRMEGNKGIGVISDFDEQPVYLNSKFGPFCIVTCGLIENKEGLTAGLLKQGISFSEVTAKGGVNVTELIAKLINQGSNLTEGIEKVFEAIDGSCSLLLLTKEGIYAARDRLGYTPLIIGKKQGAWAVTSETNAFSNLNFEIEKYLAPGEVVLLNEQGLVQKRPGNGINQICTFLWIYTGFPASSYEGISAEVARERCGACLAKKDKDIEIDIVSGVPDSGIAHALGYAM